MVDGSADPDDLAACIDHTLLRPDAAAPDVERLCDEAVRHGFASVFVNPVWTSLVASKLRGTAVKAGTVVGFPLGATVPGIKAFEAKVLRGLGADELDMVLHVGALKSGDHDEVLRDIRGVVAAGGGALVKVIIEAGLLTDEEKVAACRLTAEGGAQFVKTSTGIGHGGATVEDVKLLRETAGDALGVKASGGIRDRETALRMIRAGATRIGTSTAVAIVTGP